MKFIKVTKFDPYEIRTGYYTNSVFVPAGSQLYNMQQNQIAQQQAGSYQGLQSQQNMQQGLNSGAALQSYNNIQSQNHTFVNPKPIETQECYLNVNSVNYMINNIDSTSIFLKDNQNFNVKETPEQIMKMIHDQEFNSKMDDLLND